jgi:hypothetical protein
MSNDDDQKDAGVASQEKQSEADEVLSRRWSTVINDEEFTNEDRAIMSRYRTIFAKRALMYGAVGVSLPLILSRLLAVRSHKMFYVLTGSTMMLGVAAAAQHSIYDFTIDVAQTDGALGERARAEMHAVQLDAHLRAGGSVEDFEGPVYDGAKSTQLSSPLARLKRGTENDSGDFIERFKDQVRQVYGGDDDDDDDDDELILQDDLENDDDRT